MSKKIVENKKRKISKKMTLVIKIVKSEKSGSYNFINKIIANDNEEIKNFFLKN
ncbi:DUF4295 family protein [Blattabacterium cuenoti]|uniref:DUF4295 family protein n=1 Tax=Blattabacterium cuenoti TaxID=1653831 RepID=UPI00163B6348|nr:DUF4295 family protein [Blattabacterium cuenoti]